VITLFYAPLNNQSFRAKIVFVSVAQNVLGYSETIVIAAIDLPLRFTRLCYCGRQHKPFDLVKKTGLNLWQKHQSRGSVRRNLKFQLPNFKAK